VGTNHIYGTAEAKVVKFWKQVGYVNSQHMDDKSPLNGRGQVTWSILHFGAPNDISGMAEARILKFHAQVNYIMS